MDPITVNRQRGNGGGAMVVGDLSANPLARLLDNTGDGPNLFDNLLTGDGIVRMDLFQMAAGFLGEHGILTLNANDNLPLGLVNKWVHAGRWEWGFWEMTGFFHYMITPEIASFPFLLT